MNKVTFLLLFSVGTLLFISSVLKRSNEPEESIISILELRRATLLKHCSSKTKKSSQELSVKKLPVVSSLKPALKNLHFIRNLPGDLVFCLLKKAGSTSLTHFFTNNLEPADEAAWLDVPDEESRLSRADRVCGLWYTAGKSATHPPTLTESYAKNQLVLARIIDIVTFPRHQTPISSYLRIKRGDHQKASNLYFRQFFSTGSARADINKCA